MNELLTPNIDAEAITTADDFKTVLMLFGFTLTNPNSSRIRVTAITGDQYNISNIPAGLRINETGQLLANYQDLAYALISLLPNENGILYPVAENGRVVAVKSMSASECAAEFYDHRITPMGISDTCSILVSVSFVVGYFSLTGVYQILDLRLLA